MSLFTKLVNMFTDSVEDTAKEMKQNQVDKFADDILSNPKAKKASESLKKQEEDLSDWIKNHYKDDEYEEGLNTFLYENEQKKKEGTIKDGEKDGKWTEWYDNGQKTYEQNWKDGKLDGLVTHWFENGQKKSERTYKDGKNEIIGEWNEDGSVRE